MRPENPLILGAGPAGCAAAITLARAGVVPLLIDRDANPKDQLCGGFLSWATVERLRRLGVDPERLGAERVTHLALCHRQSRKLAPLPKVSLALSRRTLDGALRQLAVEAGAQLHIAKATAVGPDVLATDRGEFGYHGLFLATGKRDVRGAARETDDQSRFVGLRVRLPAQADLTGLIELHLFDGGYAGVAKQEDGNANICLAVRHDLLATAGGRPTRLLQLLGEEHPQLAARLDGLDDTTKVASIGAVPYGWIARRTSPGIFRLGDQAAVIPSMAGEGMGIALASGVEGARAWLSGGPTSSEAFQRSFAGRAGGPVRTSACLAGLAAHGLGRSVMALALGAGSIPLAIASRMTRLPEPERG